MFEKKLWWHLQQQYPHAMVDHSTWSICFAQRRCPCGQCDHQPVFKKNTGLLLSRQMIQNFLEPSEPCPRNQHPTYRNFQNFPEPTHWNSGTFRNLLLRPAPAHTGVYVGLRPHYLTLLGNTSFTQYLAHGLPLLALFHLICQKF